jgi:hypothetical protein
MKKTIGATQTIKLITNHKIYTISISIKNIPSPHKTAGSIAMATETDKRDNKTHNKVEPIKIPPF